MHYYDETPSFMSETWTAEFCAEQNAKLCEMGVRRGDVRELLVVDGRNAIKFKGPDAAAYLAIHEESHRSHEEFRQSDFFKNMKSKAETYEANIRAGLFTVQELAPTLFTAEEKNTLNAPKICELFTAEELEQLKNFTCADHHKTLDDLLQEGARRLRQV